MASIAAITLSCRGAFDLPLLSLFSVSILKPARSPSKKPLRRVSREDPRPVEALYGLSNVTFELRIFQEVAEIPKIEGPNVTAIGENGLVQT